MSIAKKIDAILPQTQCGLCGFKGCLPYAQALAANTATIDLCPPGGVAGLIKIANILGINPDAYIPAMEKKVKPIMRAVIREAECIGCTKCISACPVDAILGASKQMHTVIEQDCTGCELCVAPCPVDCIDMFAINEDEQEFLAKSNYFRESYQTKQARLQKTRTKRERPSKISANAKSITEKQDYIQAALLRAQAKKTK